MKIVTLLSGGMDSTTLLFYLAKTYPNAEITALGFDYGQRHGVRELCAATEVANLARKRFGDRCTFSVIDLTSVTKLLSGSSLTDRAVKVPEGHYADETMKATVVPNRNMMMLSIAGAVAVAQKAEILAYGAHAGDHPIYPDCRPIFVDMVNASIRVGNEGFHHPSFNILAPFVMMSKADIVTVATNFATAPLDLTWSCYSGNDKHCSRCGTCMERREAFQLAGIVDPTEYAISDTEFENWRRGLSRGQP